MKYSTEAHHTSLQNKPHMNQGGILPPFCQCNEKSGHFQLIFNLFTHSGISWCLSDAEDSSASAPPPPPPPPPLLYLKDQGHWDVLDVLVRTEAFIRYCPSWIDVLRCGLVGRVLQEPIVVNVDGLCCNSHHHWQQCHRPLRVGVCWVMLFQLWSVCRW